MRHFILSSLFLSTFVRICNRLELLWEVFLLQLFHIKRWAVFFLLCCLFVSPLSVSCSSLGVHHQPSLLALGNLFPHMTCPDFPISPLPCPINVHAIQSHICSPFHFSSPVPCFDLPLPTVQPVSLHSNLLAPIVSTLLCISIMCVLLQSVLLYSLIQCLTMSGNELSNYYYNYCRKAS